jgi:hypothetical protein
MMTAGSVRGKCESWIAAVLDRAPEKLDKGGRLVVGKVKLHNGVI